MDWISFFVGLFLGLLADITLSRNTKSNSLDSIFGHIPNLSRGEELYLIIGRSEADEDGGDGDDDGGNSFLRNPAPFDVARN